MDIGETISAIVEVGLFILQRLAEAIFLPLRFLLSREYRLRKYRDWEQSAGRRVLDFVSVVGTVVMIVICAVWLREVLRPATRDAPGRTTSFQFTLQAGSNAARTVHVTGEQLERFVTTEVARTAFSNVLQALKRRDAPPGPTSPPPAAAAP